MGARATGGLGPCGKKERWLPRRLLGEEEVCKGWERWRMTGVEAWPRREEECGAWAG